MHAFPELVDRCAAFTLKALEDAQEKTLQPLRSLATATWFAPRFPHVCPSC